MDAGICELSSAHSLFWRDRRNPYCNRKVLWVLLPSLSRDHPRSNCPVRLQTVIVVFAIYMGMSMVVAPGIISFVRSLYSGSPENPPLAMYGWIQLFILASVFALFYLYCRAQSPTLFNKIWKDRSVPDPKPIATDFFMGVMTWIIGFPLVIAIGQLADMILYFFGFENYEQVAVRYLKTTLGSPPLACGGPIYNFGCCSCH